MKTLGKLEINPEKILKAEELKSLKGGTMCISCLDENLNFLGGYYATAYNFTYEEYKFGCDYYYSGTSMVMYFGEGTGCAS